MQVRTLMPDSMSMLRVSIDSCAAIDANFSLREWASRSAIANKLSPATVIFAPSPPVPPTARSTNSTPALLVSVSIACQAAA